MSTSSAFFSVLPSYGLYHVPDVARHSSSVFTSSPSRCRTVSLFPHCQLAVQFGLSWLDCPLPHVAAIFARLPVAAESVSVVVTLVEIVCDHKTFELLLCIGRTRDTGLDDDNCVSEMRSRQVLDQG